MPLIKTLQLLLKRESWNAVPPSRKHEKSKPEDTAEFLRRIVRLAAARASMASWGQPFEAIASWILLAADDEHKKRKSNLFE